MSREPKPSLLLIRGLPGSGKSTYAKTLAPEWLIYEPDHLFCDIRGKYLFDYQHYADACRFVLRLADRALVTGRSIAVVDVFAAAAEIAPFRELAAFHGLPFGIVERASDRRSVHDVPAYVVERMRRAWEPVPEGELLAGRAMVEVV